MLTYRPQWLKAYTHVNNDNHNSYDYRVKFSEQSSKLYCKFYL